MMLERLKKVELKVGRLQREKGEFGALEEVKAESLACRHANRTHTVGHTHLYKVNRIVLLYCH